jgi:hypothetical protein
VLIGLDFDNTVVRYDAVFESLARQRDLPAQVAAGGKTAIRDFLRGDGREDDWTIMQGEAYGAHMASAEEFEGVGDFIRSAIHRGHRLVVVSHRTHSPYLGPPWDLHASAREWLAKRDFSQLLGDFFLEETAANKAARISALGCEVFVDDLWEFLERPDFPVGARKIWFDPSGSDQARPGLERLGGWPAAESLVFG